MSIASLRLKGFKSFGTQCDFTFSDKFTAIVGPNGSGKSNILDALKWILGEASASGLRITRQSDLLFQGSSSSPQADEAEVTLRLLTENDRASLRRVYSRDGGSSLYLDGKRVLLQDLDGVKNRFSLEGEGFALIGQGEISQTIHQRPRERRRQLDALFGIERYRERRDDSLVKLQDAKSEAERIQTLIAELNSRRSEISDDVEIAVQAQGIIDSLEVLRHDYYFVKRYGNEKEQSDVELKRHILESKLEILEKWQRFWSENLKNCEAQLDNGGQNDPSVSRLRELDSVMEAVHRRAFQLSTQVKSVKDSRKLLSDELSSLSVQKEALTSERMTIQNEQSKIQSEIDEKRAEFNEKEASFKKSQEEHQAILKKRKSMLDSLAELRLRLSRNEAEIKASSSSIQTLPKEIQDIENELSTHREKLDNFIQRKDSLEDSFTKLTSEYQLKSAKTQALRRELSHSESQYQNLSSSENFSQQPEAVRAILKAAEKNLILSKPKAAADVFTSSSREAAEAIEAFLGARQYWLLVRTMEEAQEGIDFLKANRAGRATYLALERCRPRERENRFTFSGSGVIGWAMDLVEVEEQWRDAVAHMMGDLLIVRDYKTGAEIVRSGARFPIATAEGDIFAASGTISGGASRSRAGAVTARQRADELNRKIAELTGELESEENSRKILRAKAEEAESLLDEVKAEINSEQRSVKALTKNLESLKSELSESESSITKLTRDCEVDKGKIETLEAKLSGLPDVQGENFEALLSPLKNEIRLLSERLNVSRSLSERVDSDLVKVMAAIKKSESEISAGIETEKRSRAELFRLAREKSEAWRESCGLREAISSKQNKFSRIRKISGFLRTKLSHSSENLMAMKNEIAAINARLSHLEAECSQLIELWEEKYPYDKNEASSTEGGRELTSSLRKLERELKSLGAYNLGAISEDQSLAERIDFLTDQLDDVNTSADELKALIDDTDSQVERSFTDSMSKIDARFNELFVRLFGGGEARLILQEAESVWDRGVEIFARPPGKKLQNISQLSGGEQSLTSIALIFATLEAAGSSLAVLDEVDAALDEYNLVRFAELAREYSSSIQIIAMTHRRATMERADLIYGVTMIEAGLSATVGINPETYS